MQRHPFLFLHARIFNTNLLLHLSHRNTSWLHLLVSPADIVHDCVLNVPLHDLRGVHLLNLTA